MRVWVHDGSIYVHGLPADAASRVHRHVSPVARYYSRGDKWRIPLSLNALKGLNSMGVETPDSMRAWEREQVALVSCRHRANEFKSMTTDNIRKWLDKLGVRMRRPLYDHQLLAVAYALRLPSCGLFMDTGTGKTAVAATVMQALVDLKDYKRFLVVAPRTILEVGWGKDIDNFSWLTWTNIGKPPARVAVTECPVCGRGFKRMVTWAHMRTHMDRYVERHGEEVAKRALYKKHPELLPPGQERLPVTTCPICGEKTRGHVPWSHIKKHVPPYDEKDMKALKNIRAQVYARYPELEPIARENKKRRLARALESEGVFLINPEAFKLSLSTLKDIEWDVIFVDESSILKSPTSAITKAVIEFGKGVKRRVCMTATPRPNNSLDVWGQTAFMDQCLGADFYRFREKYYRQSYDGFSWGPQTGDTDSEIWDIIRRRSYRVRLEDCVDLPGETMETMSVNLTPKLAEHYRQMMKEMQTQVDDEIVDTQWQIVQINKLAQITSGYIFDNDGVSHFLEHSPKIGATYNMAKRLIEDEDRFVVIWVRFPDTEGDRLQEMLSPYGVSTLHGHTSNVEKSVGDFLSKKNRVMIAHTQSAKFGHTWVHSNVAIFHSYDYSWENFYQAKRRIYRIGQKSPVTYVVCVAEGTIDEKILSAVFEKESASEAVVDESLRNIFRRRIGVK